MARFLSRLSATLTALVVAASMACGGGGGSSTSPPPPPTKINVTLRFSDYVPVSTAADGGRAVSIAVKNPDGVTQNTDLGQVTFTDSTSGNYCIVSGSHVKPVRSGTSQCFSVSQSGTEEYKVVRSDLDRFWSTGDYIDFKPDGRTLVADEKVFSPGDVSTINAGFDFIQQCAKGGNLVATRGSIAGLTKDYITYGSGGWDGSNMTLPAGAPNLKQASAVEGGRTYNIDYDYGGFYDGYSAGGGLTCPAELSYGVKAWNAGAK